MGQYQEGFSVKCRVCWTIFIALILFGFGFTLSSVLIDRFDRSQAPVKFHSARFIQALAHPGSTVQLEVQRTWNEACTGLVFEWWYQQGSIIQGVVSPAGASATLKVAGAAIFQKQLPGKEKLAPGEICYRPKLMYLCNGVAKLVEQPEACLDVVFPIEGIN